MDVNLLLSPDEILLSSSNIEALSIVADDLDSKSQVKMGQLIESLAKSLNNLALKITRENVLSIGHYCLTMTMNLLQVCLARFVNEYAKYFFL